MLTVTVMTNALKRSLFWEVEGAAKWWLQSYNRKASMDDFGKTGRWADNNNSESCLQRVGCYGDLYKKKHFGVLSLKNVCSRISAGIAFFDFVEQVRKENIYSLFLKDVFIFILLSDVAYSTNLYNIVFKVQCFFVFGNCRQTLRHLSRLVTE